jgi:hypothetical protein
MLILFPLCILLSEYQLTRGLPELVQHFRLFRGSSHRRKSAECPKFNMVWLYCSPIPVGRCDFLACVFYSVLAGRLLLPISVPDRCVSTLWDRLTFCFHVNYPRCGPWSGHIGQGCDVQRTRRPRDGTSETCRLRTHRSGTLHHAINTDLFLYLKN